MTKLTLTEYLILDAEHAHHLCPQSGADTASGGPLDQSPQASTLLVEQEPMTASSNRGDVYTNESHKMYDGDISKLMGCLS